MSHILILDNHLNEACSYCSRFYRNKKHGMVRMIRTKHDEIPKNIDKYSHIILTGSADDVDDTSKIVSKITPLILQAVEKQIPILGICYGHQLIAAAMTGHTSTIEHFVQPEVGWTSVRRAGPSKLLHGLPRRFWVSENHKSSVSKLPSGFRLTASSRRCKIQAMEHESLPIFSVQFHPEHTPYQVRRIVGFWVARNMPRAWFSSGKDDGRHYSKKTLDVILDNFYKIDKLTD